MLIQKKTDNHTKIFRNNKINVVQERRATFLSLSSEALVILIRCGLRVDSLAFCSNWPSFCTVWAIVMHLGREYCTKFVISVLWNWGFWPGFRVYISEILSAFVPPVLALKGLWFDSQYSSGSGPWAVKFIKIHIIIQILNWISI